MLEMQGYMDEQEAKSLNKEITMKDFIGSHEFQGMARSIKGKKKSSPPSVKAPKMSKASKQNLVPYQSPNKRSNIAYS